MPAWLVGTVALGYISLLFVVANFADNRAAAGRSLAANPYVYALSLGVYCTAWTFYGSVGLAATEGVGFLPVYLGPTLAAGTWWFTYRKIIRISRQQRITSIADFISSRYGKGRALGAAAAVIAVIGIVPYISLQLNAISTSFGVLTHTGGEVGTALAVAVALAVFAILFGTRHLDVTEHHEGLVVAIALESVVKLVAFLFAGIFVTFFLFGGPGDLFEAGAADPELARQLYQIDGGTDAYWDWLWLTVLSAIAVMFLPRQWQMAVVENQDERHLDKAIWIFPLYLFIINIFVLPIAVAGELRIPGVNADLYVLDLPLDAGQELLALFVFTGGLSAATSMVIVATLALSTMVSNDLIVPALLGGRMKERIERVDFSQLVLNIRRVAIVAIILAGFGYFRLTEGQFSLVSIGLISFAAIAQVAPAILGGLYWKAGNRNGAMAGMLGGVAVWAYTLALPTLASPTPGGASSAADGLIPSGFLSEGPFGISALRPYALFDIETMSPITSATFWSLLINAGLYVGVSLATQQGELEARQASAFVDVFRLTDHPAVWESSASIGDIRHLLHRFLGHDRGDEALEEFLDAKASSTATAAGDRPDEHDPAEPELVAHAERSLAGALGAGSARVVMASLVRETALTPDQVMGMIDETTRVIAHSRRLEEQRRALEVASAELRQANERLRDLDRMKNEFITTVTHELRTPLTSIRAFTEILSDNPDVTDEERARFLSIIQQESERLTRHINQVLDIAKIESGTMEWRVRDVNLASVVRAAVSSMEHVYASNNIDLTAAVLADAMPVRADEDRLMQVLLNLLSNAVKFTEPGAGRVAVAAGHDGPDAYVRVTDNGPGVPPPARELIFEKFRQVSGNDEDETGGNSHGRRQGSSSSDRQRLARPQGTGLGLAISREIIQHLGGRLWVDDGPDGGAEFCFTLPLATEFVR